ncbi:MAG TPA: hypothetical protein VJ347_18735 [Streptosporangiaceae bacterium]|nr:hypothetical protein [Streptosporangiaceae bacterium]
MTGSDSRHLADLTEVQRVHAMARPRSPGAGQIEAPSAQLAALDRVARPCRRA